jgi:hypothetical protein
VTTSTHSTLPFGALLMAAIAAGPVVPLRAGAVCEPKDGSPCSEASRQEISESLIAAAIDDFDLHRWPDVIKRLRTANELVPNPTAEGVIVRALIESGRFDEADLAFAALAASEQGDAQRAVSDIVERFGEPPFGAEPAAEATVAEATGEEDTNAEATAAEATAWTGEAQPGLEGRRVAPWITGSVALGTAAAAVTLGVQSDRQTAAARDYDLSEPGATLAARDAYARRGADLATGANVAWVPTAALAGATVGLIAAEVEPRRRRRATQAAAAVSVVAGPTAVQVSW